jgi:hypothetical protein
MPTTVTRRQVLFPLLTFYLLIMGTLSFSQMIVVYESIEEDLPLEVADQPIPFSHRSHFEADLECLLCHQTSETKERAGLPDINLCMACHIAVIPDHPSILKLKRLQESGEPLQWVRVYRVPDYVYFSHASHLGADLKCETCHGPVSEREVLAKEVSTSMTSCMNCHVEGNVSVECYLCHEAGL